MMICQLWYDLSCSLITLLFFRQAKHFDRFKSAILSRVQSDNLEFDPEDFEMQETDSNEPLEETDEDMLNFDAPEEETVTLEFLSDNL